MCPSVSHRNRNHMRILILLLFCTITSWATGCAASWSNGYTYCRSVTIDHTKVPNTNQTNFPVLVTGTYSYLAVVGSGGKVQSASGFDIIYTSDQQGSTTLKFERAVWSSTTGLVEFWVNVPTVSTSSDTTIYLFYGKTGVVVDPADPANTWDTNYKGVWHFGDGTTLSLTDSTANGNNGTNHGSTACTGQIVGAACFSSASTQYVDFGNNASLEITGAITIEAWVQFTGPVPGPPSFPTIVTNRTAVTDGYYIGIHTNDGGGISDKFFWSLFNSAVENDTNPPGFPGTVTQNAIYNLTVTYDSAASGSNAHMYVTTYADRDAAFGATALGASTANVTISNVPVVTGYWDGFLDEIRISNIARTGDWANTASNNTSSPSTFYTIGNEVQNGTNGGGLRLLIFR